MESITLDYTNVADLISDGALSQLQPELEKAFRMTLHKTGAGNDFLGWSR